MTALASPGPSAAATGPVAVPAAAETYLVREVAGVRPHATGAVLDLTAVRCVQVPGMPGYLTGESRVVQGIESLLPNLPDLDLPPLVTRSLELHVDVVDRATVRLVLAPAGSRAALDDGTGLGIVTTPRPAAVPVTVEQDETEVRVRGGDVVVGVGRRDFRLEVRRGDGTLLMRTSEELRQAAGLPMAPAVVLGEQETTLHLLLAPAEEVLGFGEQFSAVLKNGQRLMLRSEDALGTGTGLAYKPVPVWHSTAGYAALLNTGALVTADVGHTRPSVLGLTAADDAVDLYVMTAATPRERLGDYTRLTGRAEPPPLWSLGYWMGRCRYHSAEEMLAVAAGMREHDVPCDVLHLDPDWLVVDRLNCDFVWNEERFGQRDRFVADLAAAGVRLSLWELPYLDPASPRFEEARDRGYLVSGPDGPAQITETPTPDGRPRHLLDFGNRAARRWWQELHRPFLDDGVAVFKTDFGEGLPDVALGDGTPAHHAHNLYPLRYNAAVSEAIAEFTGRRPLVWGRSGWAGSHRYPGQWGGDAESTVAGLQATLRGGLSYALSAPGLWSHDIGGFFGPDLTPGLYVRWTQFGALSPMMRAHGLRPREPWVFGEEPLRIVRDWVRRRYALLPYLWQAMHESLAHGWPMMRPLWLEQPDDPATARVDDEYLLGSDLLVVPVLDNGTAPVERRFYVPAGGWTDLFGGERVVGPRHVTRTVSLEEMPVLVRDGAVLPRVDVRGARRTDDLVGRPWHLDRFGPDRVDRELDLVGFDGTPTHVTLRGGAAVGSGTQPVYGTVG